MPDFQFDKFTLNNIIKSLLNNIPATLGSFNAVIIGDTLIFPLGDTIIESYSAKTDKKDTTTNLPSATFTQIQDGSSILTQRVGNQLRIGSKISFDKFKQLFGIDNNTDNILTIAGASVVDFTIDFAYDNFTNTDCILITRSGIKGAGSKRLKLKDFSRSINADEPLVINIDFLFSYEDPTPPTPPAAYEVDADAVNDIINTRSSRNRYFKRKPSSSR